MCWDNELEAPGIENQSSEQSSVIWDFLPETERIKKLLIKSMKIIVKSDLKKLEIYSPREKIDLSEYNKHTLKYRNK